MIEVTNESSPQKFDFGKIEKNKKLFIKTSEEIKAYQHAVFEILCQVVVKKLDLKFSSLLSYHIYPNDSDKTILHAVGFEDLSNLNALFALFNLSSPEHLKMLGYLAVFYNLMKDPTKRASSPAEFINIDETQAQEICSSFETIVASETPVAFIFAQISKLDSKDVADLIYTGVMPTPPTVAEDESLKSCRSSDSTNDSDGESDDESCFSNVLPKPNDAVQYSMRKLAQVGINYIDSTYNNKLSKRNYTLFGDIKTARERHRQLSTIKDGLVKAESLEELMASCDHVLRQIAANEYRGKSAAGSSLRKIITSVRQFYNDLAKLKQQPDSPRVKSKIS